MKNYSIARMIGGADGTSLKMPLVPESLAFRRAYLAELRRMLHNVAKAAREKILPAYKNELVTDARESDFEALRRITKSLLLATSGNVKRLVELEANKHTERFAEAARSAFSINMQGVVEAEDLRKYIDAAALRNVGLITGMTDDLVKRLQTTTTNALIKGETVQNLRSRLKKEFDLTDNRAKLIARDQNSKLTADLNRIRHEQAGVDSYDWLTSRDERVRKDHALVNGKRYKYGEQTDTNSGAEPGQDIQCRCLAQGVIEFGEQPKKAAPVQNPKKVKPPEGVEAPVMNPLPEIPEPNKSAKFIVEQKIAEKGSTFKDFDADGLSEMLEMQHHINQRFDMKPLAGFGNSKWAVGKSPGAKHMPPSVPGWFSMRSNVMGFNPLTSDRKGLVELSSLSQSGVKKSLPARVAAIDKIEDASLKAKASSFADKFSYQSVKVTPSSIVTHENGHRFHANHYKAVESAIDGWDSGWEQLVSAYGSTNRMEFVAESFTIYVSDPTQHWRIKPELLSVFKSKDLVK